jgi:hypothetical protein
VTPPPRRGFTFLHPGIAGAPVAQLVRLQPLGHPAWRIRNTVRPGRKVSEKRKGTRFRLASSHVKFIPGAHRSTTHRRKDLRPNAVVSSKISKKCHPSSCRRSTIFRVESTRMAFIACCGVDPVRAKGTRLPALGPPPLEFC